jgi:1-acyl-sn-glycerol-3-phosphate acyltransferase
MQATLEKGRALLIFPEGTRNKSKEFLSPRGGVGMMVLRSSVPVVPVFISGTTNVWKTMAGLDRAVVRFGPPLRFGPEELQGRKAGYHKVGAAVMRAIGELQRSSGEGRQEQGALPPGNARYSA